MNTPLIIALVIFGIYILSSIKILPDTNGL